jgi:hypothetical protein
MTEAERHATVWAKMDASLEAVRSQWPAGTALVLFVHNDGALPGSFKVFGASSEPEENEEQLEFLCYLMDEWVKDAHAIWRRNSFLKSSKGWKSSNGER